MAETFLGYNLILWIQSMQNPLLDWVAVASSFLGTELFYLLFIPVFYWCWSKRAGIRLALVFLLSAYLNSALKELLHTPRPDLERVRVLYSSSGGGYSFPSGHAQNAVVFWGWIGRGQPWRSYPAALGGIVLFISLSRIYLGLHFPIDVLGGWMLGGGLLVAFVLLDRRISMRPRGWEGRILPWLGVALPIAIYPLLTQHVQIRIAGSMLGFCLGYLLESRHVQFSPKAPWSHQLLKVLGGWAGGIGLMLLLKTYLPSADPWLFIRYALLGLWVTLGLPVVYTWSINRWEAGIEYTSVREGGDSGP